MDSLVLRLMAPTQASDGERSAGMSSEVAFAKELRSELVGRGL